MGRFVTRRWEPDLTAMGPRRARQGGSFKAYVPERLIDLDLHIDARIMADLADAERAVVALDQGVSEDHEPHRLEVLARLLLRAEAVGSSQVEGLVVSPRKLALADFDAALDPTGKALEVLGNIHALEAALAAADDRLDRSTILEIHARLLENTRDAAIAGRLRDEQNWVRGHTPLDAEYVPPPPDEVENLVDDLAAYIDGDDHSALVQAAVAHAQFETIHPFADGNGRTGRALLQLVLRRRGLCRRFVPPISLVLATWSKRYVDALMATRATGRSMPGWNTWLEVLAQATRQACKQAADYDSRVVALQQRWRDRVRAKLGALRSDAAAWALIDLLPAAPLITAQTATKLTDRSERAIDGAIAQLVEAGVLEQVSGRIRYRAYEAQGVFDLVTSAERALASPAGDTKKAAPSRSVPARRRR